MAYVYSDEARQDILRMIPADGTVIGSIGCGYGATEEVLVRAGRAVHGVDISPELEALASKRLTSFAVVKPGDPLPWPENYLDGLILADVIEHIPSAWKALRDFSRHVKPGGWVAISVPNMRSVYMLKEFIFGGDWPERESGIFDGTHVQVISRKRLERWCRDADLRVEKVFPHYDPYGPRRYRFFRAWDLVTFKLFHNWFMFQVKLVARRNGGSAAVGGSKL